MSLVGNLEDLGLGEILQIVSLSRKSGRLCLKSRGREGTIVFHNGMVTQADSSAMKESLGEALVRKGLIDPPKLRQALHLQESEGFRERLGAILSSRFGVQAAAVEEVMREQVEKVVYSLFAWFEGTFDFELQDAVEPGEPSGLDPRLFMLDQGLNPQYLAMEGSRIVDERRHRGEDLEEETPDGGDENVDFAFDLLQGAPGTPPAETAAAVPAAVTTAAAKGAVILVDDDAVVRGQIASALEKAGYAVAAFERSEDTLIGVDHGYRSGNKPSVVIDLIMPRMDGTGMLGGMELLELVHNNFSDLPVVVVSDYPNGEAEARIREMGYTFLLKPRRAEMEGGKEGCEFASNLLRALAGPVAVSDAATLHGINLGDELRLELGEEIVPAGAQPVQASTGIALLRGMLEELNNPALGGGIILLVLRFASEFMNRAVVFMVKRDEIAGLGQFGISVADGNPDVRVRNLRIPRDEASLFSRVIEAQLPAKLQPDDSHWNQQLLRELGGGEPREVFLGPIISEGKVVAVLYGDNLPENRAVGDTESLEIFLSQAGLAMEKALLQRRLKDKGETE